MTVNVHFLLIARRLKGHWPLSKAGMHFPFAFENTFLTADFRFFAKIQQELLDFGSSIQIKGMLAMK